VRWQELTAGRGVRLHVRRVVDPPAPPVLLLHGLGVGGVVWQAFARRLLPHLAAVAPDLRGHGQSDAPPDGYAPADYAGDLVGVFDDLGIASAPVVGHSLGALVALALADLQPELVQWLVLLDPPLDPSLRNSEIQDVYRLRHAAPGELERYLLDRNPGGGEMLAQVLAKLFRQASDATFEAMFNRDASSLPSLPSVRTLVLQADPNAGGVLGDVAARDFVNELRAAELRKLEGAPHALHASHPKQVAEAILQFGGYTSSPGSASR
jgi:pimeloyl-ACP methyl ester carboxylesterase